jgi:hypothetical protein
MSYSTCRFCGKSEFDYDGMVKYSVRHYAHFRCFLENKGANGFLDLHDWQIVEFPYRLLEEFGLTGDAIRAMERIKEREEVQKA